MHSKKKYITQEREEWKRVKIRGGVYDVCLAPLESVGELLLQTLSLSSVSRVYFPKVVITLEKRSFFFRVKELILQIGCLELAGWCGSSITLTKKF